MPKPPDLHDPTKEEIAQAALDDSKGVIHGSTHVRPPAAHTMKELLPEKPVVKDGMAQLGNLTVQADKYPQFREAMLYESKNPEMTTIVERLEKGPYKTTVDMNSQNNNETEPHWTGNAKVHWDPSHMHVSENGAKRSPATALAHELDHADQWTHDPQRAMIHKATPAGDYGNLAEKGVIAGTERRNVMALGEGIRYGHQHDTALETRGVTSTEPVLHQRRGGVPTEVPNGYIQTGKITIDDDKVRQEIRGGQHVTYPRAECDALFGAAALEKAAADHNPVTISSAGGHVQMKEARSQGQEIQNVR
jgi:hypothetical protein